MPKIPEPLISDYLDCDIKYGIVIQNRAKSSSSPEYPFFVKDRNGVYKIPHDLVTLNKNWDKIYKIYFDEKLKVYHGTIIMFKTFPKDKVQRHEVIAETSDKMINDDEIELDICIDHSNNRCYTHCLGIIPNLNLPLWPHNKHKGYFKYYKQNNDYVFELLRVKHGFEKCNLCEIDVEDGHSCYYCALRHPYKRDDESNKPPYERTGIFDVTKIPQRNKTYP